MQDLDYPIPPIGGLSKDLPINLIRRNNAQDLDGVWSYYGRIRRMPGKVKLSTDQLAGGSVMRFFDWIEDDGTTTLIAISQDKAYKLTGGDTFTSIQDGDDFTMSAGQYPDVCSHYDDSGDQIVIMVNYADDTRKFDGSSMNTLAGSPPKAKFCSPYKNYLMLGHTFESAVDYPRRVRWSAVGNGESWPADNTRDFLLTNDVIMRLLPLRDRQIVYKEKSISIMDHVGGTYTFETIENYIGNRGLVGPYAVRQYGENVESHYFISDELEIYKFDSLELELVSPGVKRYLANVSPTYKDRIQSVDSREYDKIIWALPGRNQDSNLDLLIFDVIDRTYWIKQGEPITVSALGKYKVETSYTWDTLPYDTWDEWDWPDGWDTNLGEEEAPRILVGGSDGYVRYLEPGVDDDGTDIDSHYFYGFDDFDTGENVLKKLTKVVVEVYNEGSGSIKLEVFSDNNDDDARIINDDGDMYATINTYTDDENREIFDIEVDVDVDGYNFAFKLSTDSGTWSARVKKVFFEPLGDQIT